MQHNTVPQYLYLSNTSRYLQTLKTPDLHFHVTANSVPVESQSALQVAQVASDISDYQNHHQYNPTLELGLPGFVAEAARTANFHPETLQRPASFETHCTLRSFKNFPGLLNLG